MASVNKAIILGHLGRDPEVRYRDSGDAVANVSIATSETWKIACAIWPSAVTPSRFSMRNSGDVPAFAAAAVAPKRMMISVGGVPT